MPASRPAPAFRLNSLFVRPFGTSLTRVLGLNCTRRFACGVAWAFLAITSMALAAEVETDSPLPPESAAATMEVPEGFRVTLFAGEPDVRQPIGFCFDDRGRLWVAEAYSYPRHQTEGRDRIVIFEDTDGDGRFDKRTVFYDRLNYVTGIEVGFGGAWVMSPPYFYFIPDADGDDVPDGEPQLLLDGFGTHANSHNLANALAWGPDGWLYGTHGRTNWSTIGKPGAGESEREVFDGGVYRYHPTRHVWEPFADGTTNPWGIDWDDYGQAFVCNCVNPHLFHVIPGAHYEPWRNRQSSRYAYERIETIADHLHFVGTENVRDGLGSDDEDIAGGGHAHCGTMIYLGDNWPDRYRNQVFMHNLHGKRINQDRLRRSGSGYVASHAPDLMRSADPWFMGVTLGYGPDGAVYSSDWSDTGECHSVRNTHRETGRIFKISYGEPSAEPFLISDLSDVELAELQTHRNEWYVRHSRRILQERAAAGSDLSEAYAVLRQIFENDAEVPRKLRAMWTLYASGGADTAFFIRQWAHPSEDVRGWAIRLAHERPEIVTAEMLRALSMIARQDRSPLVRLSIASVLQRILPGQRWDVAAALLSHGEDASDANLPLMNWYAIEPLFAENVERFVSLARNAQIPLVRRHIARRVAEAGSADGLQAVVRMLDSDNPAANHDLIEGILAGSQGRRTVPMPTAWPTVYQSLRRSPESRRAATRLALLFDDPVAVDLLRQEASDAQRTPESRKEAVRTLVAKKPAGLDTDLLSWLDDAVIRGAALRGLAEYAHPDTAAAILDRYPDFDTATRQDALQTLASRTAWGERLLDAVERGEVPRTDLSAFTARQLRSLDEETLGQRVTRLWGQVRTTPADKRAAIVRYQKLATPQRLAIADRGAGRAIFAARCASCHRLFDDGPEVEVGPDLTGSQRTHLGYLLENVIDPSATVSKDYQMQVIQTDSGRVITGLLIATGEQSLTLQTTTDRVIVPLDEIESRRTSPLSVMPEGLLEQLSDAQVIELLAYLSGPGQVPLPESFEPPPVADSPESGGSP